MIKAIVSLSGGMDSTTVLALALAEKREVLLAANFFYGSKHNPYEAQAARRIADHYKVPFKSIELSHAFEGTKSALVDRSVAVPEGHSEQETQTATIVPGRNLVFIAVLASIAESMQADEIYIGPHAGDNVIYPDCRPEFVNAARLAVRYSTNEKVALKAPFLSMDAIYKTEILRMGLDLKVPYELTRTCYKPHSIACGKCGSCQERLAGFAALGIEDPIKYQTRELIAKE